MKHLQIKCSFYLKPLFTRISMKFLKIPPEPSSEGLFQTDNWIRIGCAFFFKPGGCLRSALYKLYPHSFYPHDSWSFLEITTSSRYNDSIQAYAAGAVEAAVTSGVS